MNNIQYIYQEFVNRLFNYYSYYSLSYAAPNSNKKYTLQAVIYHVS